MTFARCIGITAFAFMVAVPGSTQPATTPQPQQPVERQDGLDPNPVDPAVDPDVRMFLSDWRSSAPRIAFGALVFRDILTPLTTTDPLRPASRGAVLTAIGALSRATLAPGARAEGRMPAGQRSVFYTSAGTGELVVNGRSHAVHEGVFFTLAPDFDFRLTSTGTQPLQLYVRTEPLPPGTAPSPEPIVVSRWNNDRRVGAHWMHICNGGAPGMMLCTIAPQTMPQPHSHNYEELWLLVKGESILMLGKHLIPMRPGQAYKIPPNGLAAHSNLNLGSEPIQMIYMGPAVRPPRQPLPDFAQLENTPIDPAGAPDIDMFIGDWRDAYPRIAHGNLYMRDMLTGLTGGEPLRPIRKGAVLIAAEAVSHAMLEPGATAHRVEGASKDARETFVVTAGTGHITVAGRQMPLRTGKAFTIGPDDDFRLTATGDRYLTFYVIREKPMPGRAAPAGVAVVDHQALPAIVRDWHTDVRPVVTAADGLHRFGAINQVVLKPMAMARPASAAPGSEQIWIALDDVDLLFGKQLRRLRAGTAYKVPATGITAHAGINLGSKPVTFLQLSTAP